jgi:hypothetical protein
MTAYMPVRYRRGVVGETKRSCHLVPAPAPDAVPEFLIALCGQKFAPGTADLLELFRGMPCEQCVALATARTAPGEIAG